MVPASETHPSDRLAVVLPIAAVIAAMASFQLGAAFAKSLFPVLGPLGTATLRVVLGAAVLVVFGRPWRNWPTPARLFPLVAFGVAMVATILMFYFAIARLPLGVAMALQFLGPLGLAVAGSRRAIDLVWAGLAGLGVWGLTLAGQGSLTLDWVGVLWGIGAGAGWACYIVFGRAASKAFGGATAGLSMVIGAVLMLPFGLHEAREVIWTTALIGPAIGLALFTAAIPLTLDLYAMPRMKAQTFSIFMSLEPAFAVAVGYVFLQERLAAFQIIGIVAVMLAALGSSWSATAADQDQTS